MIGNNEKIMKKDKYAIEQERQIAIFNSCCKKLFGHTNWEFEDHPPNQWVRVTFMKNKKKYKFVEKKTYTIYKDEDDGDEYRTTDGKKWEVYNPHEDVWEPITDCEDLIEVYKEDK